MQFLLYFKKKRKDRLFIGPDSFALIIEHDPNIHFDYGVIPDETMNTGVFIYFFLTENSFHLFGFAKTLRRLPIVFPPEDCLGLAGGSV